jgi:hypothetical protein
MTEYVNVGSKKCKHVSSFLRTLFLAPYLKVCGTLKPVLRDFSVICHVKSFPCNHISNFEKETIDKLEEEKP